RQPGRARLARPRHLTHHSVSIGRPFTISVQEKHNERLVGLNPDRTGCPCGYERRRLHSWGAWRTGQRQTATERVSQGDSTKGGSEETATENLMLHWVARTLCVRATGEGPSASRPLPPPRRRGATPRAGPLHAIPSAATGGARWRDASRSRRPSLRIRS